MEVIIKEHDTPFSLQEAEKLGKEIIRHDIEEKTHHENPIPQEVPWNTTG